MPLAAVPTFAQTPSANPPAARVAPVVPANRPDVQILVLTLPTGTTAISSVYQGQVSKAVAQGRLDRLIQITGWKAQKRRFSDAPAPPNPLQDKKSPQKLSAASFETTDTVSSNDGTIDWEPFLRAFGDLAKVNVIYVTPAEYKGPLQYDSERLQFAAYPVQGTVTLVANIKRTGKDQAAFGIPKYAAVNPVQEKRAAVSNSVSGRRTIGIALAVTFAALFAFVVYKWTSSYAVRR